MFGLGSSDSWFWAENVLIALKQQAAPDYYGLALPVTVVFLHINVCVEAKSQKKSPVIDVTRFPDDSCDTCDFRRSTSFLRQR